MVAKKKRYTTDQHRPCLGIKQCPQEGCKYVVPIRDKRKCPDHDMNLEKTTITSPLCACTQGKYQKQGRPYLVSAGIEEGIRYVFMIHT